MDAFLWCQWVVVTPADLGSDSKLDDFLDVMGFHFICAFLLWVWTHCLSEWLQGPLWQLSEWFENLDGCFS